MFTRLVLLGLGLTASAAPILWTLDGVRINITPAPHISPGSASGTFLYDAAANQYSGIQIQTTHYAPMPLAFAATQVTGVSLQDRSAFAIRFESPLTDSGGSVDVANALAGRCLDDECGHI